MNKIKYVTLLSIVALFFSWNTALATNYDGEIASMLDAAKSHNETKILEAEAQLKKIERPVKGDVASARKLNDAGLAALKQGDTDSAIQALKKAHDTDPSNAELSNNLGYAALVAGKNEDAKTALMNSIALMPTRSSAWLNLGEVFGSDGKVDQSVTSFYLAWFFSKNRDKTSAYITKLTASSNTKLAAAANKALTDLGVSSAEKNTGKTQGATEETEAHSTILAPNDKSSEIAADTTPVSTPGASSNSSSEDITSPKASQATANAGKVAPIEESTPKEVASNNKKPDAGFSGVFNGIYTLLVAIFLVGLINPKWILRWTTAPSRMKIIAYFLVIALPFGLLGEFTKSKESRAYETKIRADREAEREAAIAKEKAIREERANEIRTVEANRQEEIKARRQAAYQPIPLWKSYYMAINVNGSTCELYKEQIMHWSNAGVEENQINQLARDIFQNAERAGCAQ